MTTILDKDVINAKYSNNPGAYANRYSRKDDLCMAAKFFVNNTVCANVTMPKKGNGSNFTVGNVDIRIGVNNLTFDVKDSHKNKYEWTGLSISMYCFRKLELDINNCLLIINGKIAISYT